MKNPDIKKIGNNQDQCNDVLKTASFKPVPCRLAHKTLWERLFINYAKCKELDICIGKLIEIEENTQRNYKDAHLMGLER